MPVELKGADKLRKALREFEPDLAKATTKQMAAALKPITNKARGFMPATGLMLSGWTSASSSTETTNYRHFPKYDQTEAKRGVKYSTSPSKPNKRGFVSLARIINSSLNPNAGKQFIARANSLGNLVNARPRQQGQAGRSTRKMTGRVIFRAFAEDQGRVTAAVVKAIGNSAIEFKAKTGVK